MPTPAVVGCTSVASNEFFPKLAIRKLSGFRVCEPSLYVDWLSKSDDIVVFKAGSQNQPILMFMVYRTRKKWRKQLRLCRPHL